MEGMERREMLSNVGLLDNLKLAIRSGDFVQTKQVLTIVDDYLVGASSIFNPDAHELEDFVDGQIDSVKIYLGDGGMSRLVIDRDNDEVTIDITDNATDPVKARWVELIGK